MSCPARREAIDHDAGTSLALTWPAEAAEQVRHVHKDQDNSQCSGHYPAGLLTASGREPCDTLAEP